MTAPATRRQAQYRERQQQLGARNLNTFIAAPAFEVLTARAHAAGQTLRNALEAALLKLQELEGEAKHHSNQGATTHERSISSLLDSPAPSHTPTTTTTAPAIEA
jgi:hypothetical protein